MEGEAPEKQAAVRSIEWGIAPLDADGLAHWASKDFWRVYEAAHLLLGYAPDGRWYVEYSPLDIARKPPRREEQPEHWKVWELYGRIKDAVDAEDVAALEFGGFGLDKVRPRHVVPWARMVALRPGMDWLIVPDFPTLARDTTAAADWLKWAIRPAWKAWQACYLLCGWEPNNNVGPRPFEPNINDPAEFLMLHTPPEFLCEFYELLKSHAMAGTLPLAAPLAAPEQFPDAYISRDALIAWAREHWDHYLPPELVAIFPSTPASATPAPAPSQQPQTDPVATATAAIFAITPATLAQHFGCPKHGGQRGHESCWGELCRDAKEKKLDQARAVKGRGRAPSKWDALKVAQWLIDRGGRDRNTTADELLAAIPEDAQYDSLRKQAEAMKRPRTSGPNPWAGLAK